MPVVRKAEAVRHELHGSTFHSYAAPARGSAELCAWRLEVAAGTRGVPHRVSREEVFLVLGGELRATVDGQPSSLAAGDVLVVGAGSELSVGNAGGRPASVWVTTSVGLEATMADGTTISPPWVR